MHVNKAHTFIAGIAKSKCLLAVSSFEQKNNGVHPEKATDKLIYPNFWGKTVQPHSNKELYHQAEERQER